MQELGLRPRLRLFKKGSFYDLVKSQNFIGNTTTANLIQEQPQQLAAAQNVPLPPSPTSTRKLILPSPPPLPITFHLPVQAAEELKEAITMVPVSLKCSSELSKIALELT